MRPLPISNSTRSAMRKRRKKRRKMVLMISLTELMTQTRMVKNVRRMRQRSMLHSSIRRRPMRMAKRRRSPTLIELLYSLNEEEQTKENIAYSNSRSIISQYTY